MKTLFYVSMIIIVASMSLQAKSIYIQVASLYKKENLFIMSYRLNALGYKINLSEKDGLYKVYTGPFKDEYDAKWALSDIKKNIAKEAVLVEVEFKGNKLTVLKDIKQLESQQNNRVQVRNGMAVASEKNKKSMQNNNSYFIGVSIGTVKLALDRKNISMSSVAYTCGISTGYYYTKNVYMTLNYNRSTLSTAYLDTFSTSINYKFNPLFLVSPYVGLIGGMNVLKWKSDNYKDNQESSFMPSIQLGAEIAISDNATLILFGKYMMLDYKAVAESSSQKTVKFTNEISGNVGLRYNF